MGFFNTLGLLAGWLVWRGADDQSSAPEEIAKRGRKRDKRIQQDTGLLPPTDDSTVYRPAIPLETERIQQCGAALDRLYSAIGWLPVSAPIWVPLRALETHTMILERPRITRYTRPAGVYGHIVDVIADTAVLDTFGAHPTNAISTIMDNVATALGVYRAYSYVHDPATAGTQSIQWCADTVHAIPRSSAQIDWFDMVQQRILAITRVLLEAAYNVYAVQHNWRVLPGLMHRYGHMTWTEYAAAVREEE